MLTRQMQLVNCIPDYSKGSIQNQILCCKNKHLVRLGAVEAILGVEDIRQYSPRQLPNG